MFFISFQAKNRQAIIENRKWKYQEELQIFNFFYFICSEAIKQLLIMCTYKTGHVLIWTLLATAICIMFYSSTLKIKYTS